MLTIIVSRYQPTKLEQSLYSKGRAAKLLKTTTTNIEFIYPMAGDRVAIGLWDRWELMVLDKKDFLSLHSEDRKQKSGGMVVTKDLFNDDVYRARNPRNDHLYKINLNFDHLTCECQDYENQVKLFGSKQVICKHGYAVLNQLGYGSLSAYVQHQVDRWSEPEYGALCMGQGRY